MSAPYFVPVGENGQELLDRGSLLFPCAIYQRDIREYVGGEITPHWHREMEVFVLESGQASLFPGRRKFLCFGAVSGCL